jgi:D-alanyl-D-alanine carboxypeptidase
MRRLIRISILLTASSFTSLGQNINALKLDSLLNTLASKDLARGSLAISKSGIVIYQKALGYSSISNYRREPADINTRYKIGSTTKMFTAVMIFQLIEEGKIQPDQKLSTYFPDLPNASKITIQDMLYHRSGLHDYTKDTDFYEWMGEPKSHDELLNIVKGKGSDFEPGTRAEYSNSNYLLLGYMIERICKMPYADAIEKRITSKLNLKDTYVGNPLNANDGSSVSYKYSNGTWKEERETHVSIHGGAGSIVSTPTDLVAFMDALFSGKLVSERSLSRMKTIVDGYGMGMFSDKYGSKPSFGHNGRIEEFYSALWHFPAEGVSFAYCTNGIDYPRTDLIEGILKICFNESFQIPFTQNGNLKGEELDKYVGKYSSDQIVVNCTSDGTKLSLETRGKVFEVESIGDHYFMNAASGYFFEFHPDKGELQIKETDNIYFLKRTN